MLFIEKNAYIPMQGQQMPALISSQPKTILLRRGSQRKITEIGHITMAVQHNDRNCVVVIQHFQDKIESRVCIGLVERPHSLGPHLQSERVSTQKKPLRTLLFSRASCLKEGGHLLSRIALQYHRRKWA